MGQRGQMIERSGSWWLRVYIGRNAQGKKQYVSQTFHGTAKEAEQALTKMLHDADNQQLVRTTKDTLKSFLPQWEAWKVDTAQSTMDGYKRHLELYVLPYLGHRALSKITPLAVQTMINKLIEKGLSPRTIEYAVTVLHQVLGRAVDLGILAKNPTEKTTKPAKVQRDLTVLSPEQMNTLLQEERKSKYYALWLTLLTTGLRPQEALALRWSDLDGDTLRVAQVLSRRNDGSYEIVDRAKTEKSLRPVTLSQDVLAALKATRRAIEGPIFPNRVGGYLDPQNISKRFKSALKRAGLPSNVRLYDTRHSHATALLNAGVNLKHISARLGHSSVTVTEQVYARVLPEAHREMAEVTQEILRKAASK